MTEQDRSTEATRGQSGGLIQSGPRELLLAKLDSYKVLNLTAKEKEAADLIEYNYVRKLAGLSYIVLGISREQIKSLSSEELRELEQLLLERTKRRARLQYMSFMIPILGWMAYVLGSVGQELPVAIQYRKGRKKLQKIYGKNYVPDCSKI